MGANTFQLGLNWARCPKCKGPLTAFIEEERGTVIRKDNRSAAVFVVAACDTCGAEFTGEVPLEDYIVGYLRELLLPVRAVLGVPLEAPVNKNPLSDKRESWDRTPVRPAFPRPKIVISPEAEKRPPSIGQAFGNTVRRGEKIVAAQRKVLASFGEGFDLVYLASRDGKERFSRVHVVAKDSDFSLCQMDTTVSAPGTKFVFAPYSPAPIDCHICQREIFHFSRDQYKEYLDAM